MIGISSFVKRCCYDGEKEVLWGAVLQSEAQNGAHDNDQLLQVAGHNCSSYTDDGPPVAYINYINSSF